MTRELANVATRDQSETDNN